MRLGGATNKNIKNIYLGNVEILNSWIINDLSIPILLLPKKIIKRLFQFL
jgi:glycosyltransferase